MKKGWVIFWIIITLLVFVVAPLYMMVATAECYVGFIGDSCDINRAFWDSKDYIRLDNGVERTDWDAVKEISTPGLDTACHSHTLVENHHTMLCDRTATQLGDYDFLTYFKNNNAINLKATEIVTEQRTGVSRIPDGGKKEVICPKDSKNTTCYEDTYKEKSYTWTETREVPVSIGKEGVFDFKALSKTAFVLSQKRTYRIEWDDANPTEVLGVMQGNERQGRLEFPSKGIYENELKINPTQYYNYSKNNWAGDYWETELDASKNITLGSTSSSITLDTSPALRLWLPMNDTAEPLLDRTYRTNFAKAAGGYTFEVAGNGYYDNKAIQASADTYSYNTTDTSDIFSGQQNYTLSLWTYIAAASGIISMGVDAGSVNDFAVYYRTSDSHFRIIEGLEGVLRCDLPASVNTWYNLVVMHNSTGGYCYLNNIYNASWVDAFTPVITPPGGGLQIGRLYENAAYKLNGKLDDLRYYNRSLTIAEINALYTGTSDTYDTGEGGGGTTYATAGNFTSAGFCPNYPDSYNWGLFNFSIINSTTGNAMFEYRVSADNTSWGAWKPAPKNEILNDNGACFQYRANLTTTNTATTPRVSGVSVFYSSTKPPEIYIDLPQNTTYSTNSLSLNVTFIDPDGINWTGYSLDGGLTNTTIIDYRQNATLSALVSGSNTVWVYANDSDNQYNESLVTFFINLAPSQPALHLPINNSKVWTIPQLNWSNSTDSEGDAIFYHLLIDDTPDFIAPIWNNTHIIETANTTGITPAGLAVDNTYFWKVLATDTYSNSSWSEVRAFNYSSGKPFDITPLINSTQPTLNRTDADVLCIFQPLSERYTTGLTANITWWVDDILNTTQNSIAVTNGTNYEGNLSASKTHRDDIIKCEVSIFDGAYASAPRNSSNLTVMNTYPTTPTTLYPANATNTENTTNEFRCSGSTDADLDPIGYSFYLDTGATNPPTTFKQGNSSTEYYASGMDTIGEYLWRCRSNDTTNYSDYTQTRMMYMDYRDILSNTTYFKNPVLSGEHNLINLSLPYNNLSVKDVSVVLNYNGTNYATTEVAGNGSYSSFSAWVNAPAVTSNSSTKFSWNVTITYVNRTNAERILAGYEQIIVSPKMFGCNGVTNASQAFALNFTFYEENVSKPRTIAADAYTYLYYYRDNVTSNQILLQTNLSSEYFYICISPPYASLTVDGIVEYKKTGYKTEHYYFYNDTLSNTTKHIGLYMIGTGTGEGVNVKITVQDQYYEGLPNHYVKAMQWDTELGVYRLVEIGQTDSSGQTIIQLKLYDTIYKFLVEDISHKVVYESSPIKVQAETLEFTIDLGANLLKKWEDIAGTGFSYSLRWDNETSLVTYIYSDSLSKLSNARMVVQNIAFNNETSAICNTSLTTYSGVITCNVTGRQGSIKAVAYANENIIDVLTFELSEIWKTFGTSGVFWGIALIVTLGLIGSWNPVVSIGLTLVGIISVSALGIMGFGTASLVGIVVVGVVLIISLRS